MIVACQFPVMALEELLVSVICFQYQMSLEYGFVRVIGCGEPDQID
jgi:hypothetical protein